MSLHDRWTNGFATDDDDDSGGGGGGAMICGGDEYSNAYDGRRPSRLLTSAIESIN